MTTAREIRLARRPVGWPRPEDFELATVPLPEPADGQVLIRNLVMSVDPYMRGRMNDARSYVPPFALGAPLDGGAVGEVVATRAAAVRVGDTVLHDSGWRSHALTEARRVRVVDVSAVPPAAYLDMLGLTGLTAYAGLLDVAAMRPGDRVFVSGGAGAVGSAVVQIARQKGASLVLASAGSDPKVEFLQRDLGLQTAFNYRTMPTRLALRRMAPDGIDVYFDNVGGDTLEAAISAMRRHGRIALCGAISQYNATEPAPGPRNLGLAIGRRLTLRGFIVGDHEAMRAPFEADMTGWLRSGAVIRRETVVNGLEHAPEAFIGMLRGENIGKMIVRL